MKGMLAGVGQSRLVLGKKCALEGVRFDLAGHSDLHPTAQGKMNSLQK